MTVNVEIKGKPLADAEKALKAAAKHYDEKSALADVARRSLEELVSQARESSIPADPVELEERQMKVRQAEREVVIAGRARRTAQQDRDAAFEDAVARMKPDVQAQMNALLERILDAGAELKNALDEYDELERAWRLKTGNVGAVRADPPGDLAWRFLQLNLGRSPSVGGQFDQIVNRFGRKPVRNEPVEPRPAGGIQLSNRG